MVCVDLWRPSGVPVIDEMLSKVAQARPGWDPERSMFLLERFL